jgi:hypothetical protein
MPLAPRAVENHLAEHIIDGRKQHGAGVLLGGPGKPGIELLRSQDAFSVPRTITEMGLFSTKRANTLPSMVASSESLSKGLGVTNGEWEDH